MFFLNKRLAERKYGLNKLESLLDKKSKLLIIHYSCESFKNTKGRSPRINCICITSLESAQTKMFSIHLEAQFKHLDINNLSDSDIDELEKALLSEYFKFVKAHKTNYWLHWAMRDANYGFEAIDNRYRILGGTPIQIEDEKKIEFVKLLGSIYTMRFESDSPHGRLLNLAERNNISTKDAQDGKKESDLFDSRSFLELSLSTHRKVRIMESIFHMVEHKSLKVAARNQDIYGLSLKGINEIIKNNPWFQLIYSIILFLLGLIVTVIFQRIFKFL